MEEFSRQAAFRYQVVSQVLSRILAGETQREAVLAVAALEHYFPGDGHPRRVSQRAIYRWLEIYRDCGLKGLQSASRGPGPAPSSVLPGKFVEFLVEQKNKDPRSSIPQIIRRAVEYGILKQEDPVDRTTAYRTARTLGLTVAHRKKAAEREVRRFAYPHRMDMILSDGLHFRAGATRARRVAMFYLDDSTRFGLHAVVGTSENAALFQRGLFELVLNFGFFSIMYFDKGPGFIAEDTIAVVRNLQALLIHGETAYPQGHGKIEKFNQTARADLLRTLDRRPDVDPEPCSLELRLRHYLTSQYNHRGHESLQKESPYHRFTTDPKELRFPESIEELRGRFEIYITRRVSADNVVSVDSTAYDMPLGYDGTKVTLRRKLLSGGGLFFLHQGRLIELHPTDLEANARSRRGRGPPAEGEVEHPLPPSAADLHFQRELGTVVDLDGGCPDPKPPSTPQEEP
jgi:putative transposase